MHVGLAGEELSEWASICKTKVIRLGLRDKYPVCEAWFSQESIGHFGVTHPTIGMVDHHDSRQRNVGKYILKATSNRGKVRIDAGVHLRVVFVQAILCWEVLGGFQFIKCAHGRTALDR